MNKRKIDTSTYLERIYTFNYNSLENSLKFLAEFENDDETRKLEELIIMLQSSLEDLIEIHYPDFFNEENA